MVYTGHTFMKGFIGMIKKFKYTYTVIYYTTRFLEFSNVGT